MASLPIFLTNEALQKLYKLYSLLEYFDRLYSNLCAQSDYLFSSRKELNPDPCVLDESISKFSRILSSLIKNDNTSLSKNSFKKIVMIVEILEKVLSNKGILFPPINKEFFDIVEECKDKISLPSYRRISTIKEMSEVVNDLYDLKCDLKNIANYSPDFSSDSLRNNEIYKSISMLLSYVFTLDENFSEIYNWIYNKINVLICNYKNSPSNHRYIYLQFILDSYNKLIMNFSFLYDTFISEHHIDSESSINWIMNNKEKFYEKWGNFLKDIQCFSMYSKFFEFYSTEEMNEIWPSRKDDSFWESERAKYNILRFTEVIEQAKAYIGIMKSSFFHFITYNFPDLQLHNINFLMNTELREREIKKNLFSFILNDVRIFISLSEEINPGFYDIEKFITESLLQKKDENSLELFCDLFKTVMSDGDDNHLAMLRFSSDYKVEVYKNFYFTARSLLYRLLSVGIVNPYFSQNDISLNRLNDFFYLIDMDIDLRLKWLEWCNKFKIIDFLTKFAVIMVRKYIYFLPTDTNKAFSDYSWRLSDMLNLTYLDIKKAYENDFEIYKELVKAMCLRNGNHIVKYYKIFHKKDK